MESGSKPNPPSSTALGDQVPGVGDRAFLEVVAEGEVAVHLEERAVPRGLADLLDVEGAHALLHAGRPRERRGLAAGQVRDERDHAGDGEQQRRVGRDQRRAGDDGVPALGEVLEEAAADLGGLHVLLGSAGEPSRRGTVRVSLSAECAPRCSAWATPPAGSGASSPVPARSSFSRSAIACAHVGTEVADGVGQVAQRLGDRAGDTAGGHLLGGAGELAHDQDTDRDAHGEPEQPAHQAARRAARRARRASLSRCAASATAWPSRFFLVAVRTP